MNSPRAATNGRWLLAGELVMMLLLIFVVAGRPAPNVNESHYLARAKHFWNPQWCAGDLFLDSREAQPVFCWTFGWISQFAPLPVFAWIGRVIGWGALSVGWLKLSRSMLPGKHGWHLLSFAVAIVLCQRASMAGEWFVGGIESKVPAYALLFFGLADLIGGRWSFALPWFGAAAAFHPLVGGWALVASVIAWPVDPRRPEIKSLLPAAGVAVVLSLPGVLPALQLDTGIDVESIKYARRTYVFQRLGHHLLILRMRPWLVARHLLLIGAWAGLWRFVLTRIPAYVSERIRRLNGFVLGCVLIALTGITIELITHRNSFICSSWMRYYWYRMTDCIVPLGFAMTLATWIANHDVPPDSSPGEDQPAVEKHGRLPIGAEGQALVISLLLITVSVTATFWVNSKDRRAPADKQGRIVGRSRAEQQQDDRDWKATCAWCRENTSSDTLFLTPVFNQTFKWYAGRPEYANWKDIPQDSQSIMQWRERRKAVGLLGLYRLREKPTTDEIRTWAKQQSIDYIIIDRHYGEVSWELRVTHSNDSYVIFRVPK